MMERWLYTFHRKTRRAAAWLGVVAALALFGVPALAQRDLPDAPVPSPELSPQQQRPKPNPAEQARAGANDARTTQRYQQTGMWQRKYLFGNWNGERTRLENKGVVFDFYYTADALANTSGDNGHDDATWWGRIRGTVDLDFSKFTQLRGLTFHMTSIWQYGTDIGGTNYVDSIANPSSLASVHVFRAAEYWLNESIFQHHLFLRGGKTAPWNNYGVQEYGASFLNEPMGYAFNTLFNTYMAYDPGGTPGFEVRVLPTVHYYVKAMVNSTEPSPYAVDPRGFNFHLTTPVVSTEAGYVHDPPQPPKSTATLGLENFVPNAATGNHPGTYKFGGSYTARPFTNQLTGQSSTGNNVIWGEASQAIYRESYSGPNKNRGLDLTAAINHSPNDVNQQNQQMDAGLRYVGPFRGKHFSKDMLDVGWVRSSDGSAYRGSLELKGQHVRPENLFEINYLSNLTPWLLFQPTAEFLLNPGTLATRRKVVVLGFRTRIVF